MSARSAHSLCVCVCVRDWLREIERKRWGLSGVYYYPNDKIIGVDENNGITTTSSHRRVPCSLTKNDARLFIIIIIIRAFSLSSQTWSIPRRCQLLRRSILFEHGPGCGTELSGFEAIRRFNWGANARRIERAGESSPLAVREVVVVVRHSRHAWISSDLWVLRFAHHWHCYFFSVPRTMTIIIIYSRWWTATSFAVAA